MSEPLLQDSFDKINWARRHAKKLDQKIERRVRSRTYKLSHEFDTETREFLVVWSPEPLSPKFGLRIGDVVHNLRSALDHAAWELTERNGTDPEMLTQPRVQFPICSVEDDFNGLGMRQIRGVHEVIQGIIREHQPYKTRADPREDPLAILADLSNADKHRVITPVQAAVQINTTAIEKTLAANLGLIEPGYFVTPTGRLLKPRQAVTTFSGGRGARAGHDRGGRDLR